MKTNQPVGAVREPHTGSDIPPALDILFNHALTDRSDINEHVYTLAHMAMGVRHVTEFGTRTGVSTTAFAMGLAVGLQADLSRAPRMIHCYDMMRHPEVTIIEQAARENGVGFQFHLQDTRAVMIEETDLLFIDTLHTYAQVRDELASNGNQARKWLVFHDTELFKLLGEKPNSIGIWPAITDFVVHNPHWRLHKHYSHNNGLTTFRRCDT